MEKKYQLDDKLQFYHELLVQMASRVEESIALAREAFEKEDVKLSEKVKGDDYFIDKMRDLIESDGVRILISEAPYGQYMRQVIAGMKIVTSLERMGDHACHLAALAVMPMTPRKHQDIAAVIAEMAEADHHMAAEVIDALVRMDSQKAREIAKMDDEVDRLNAKAGKMIIAVDAADVAERENLFDYHYVSKELERFGDHVTNICAWIVYMAEGVKPDLN